MLGRIALLVALGMPWAMVSWGVQAGEGSVPCPALEEIDRLVEQGGKERDGLEGHRLMKTSLDVCMQCLEEGGETHELLWRCARSAHQYAETARDLRVEGWKKICKEWGKRGMEFAERAQAIAPERVEGYFWEAACIGVYADGTGIVTAVKEGFYKKSKTAMSRAYALNKSYNDYDPVFGSAMFWITLPFPLKNKKKALAFYREFEENTSWKVRPNMRRIYGAHLLMEVKPKGYREEARRLLEEALSCPRLAPYYRDWGRELLAELD